MKILLFLISSAAFGQYIGTAPLPQKFLGTTTPGSVSGNLPGDLYLRTSTGDLYVCSAASGTAAPACTSVAGGAWTLVNVSGGATAFSALTSATNTTAAMVVGSGGSLTVSGSGTNNATSVDGLGETSAATASKLATRDANGNLLAVGFLDNVTSTATDGSSTITLTVASSQTQKSTGSTTLIYQMPVTSTLALNQKYYFNNLSTGAVTVNSSGGNAVIILAGGTSAVVKCILTSGTSAASWSVAYAGMLITSGKLLTGTNTITLSGTDGTVWTGPSTSFSVARIDAAQTFTGTQTFGAIVGTTFNGNTFTTGTGILTLAAGKTLTASNTITLAGTDSTVWTGPSTNFSVARIDAAQTFTGTQTFGALVGTTFNGNTFTTGTGVLTIAASKTATFSNTLTFTGTDSSSVAFGTGGTVLYNGGALGTPGSGNGGNLTNLPLTSVTGAGTNVLTFLATPSGANFNSMIASGGIPVNCSGTCSKTAAYTTVLGDGGGTIVHASSDNNARTFTIDSNANVAYPLYTVITIVNLVNTVTIAITSDTMTLAGTASTGSRTLAVNGIATLYKIGTTSWLVSGPGVT